MRANNHKESSCACAVAKWNIKELRRDCLFNPTSGRHLRHHMGTGGIKTPTSALPSGKAHRPEKSETRVRKWLTGSQTPVETSRRRAGGAAVSQLFRETYPSLVSRMLPAACLIYSGRAERFLPASSLFSFPRRTTTSSNPSASRRRGPKRGESHYALSFV